MNLVLYIAVFVSLLLWMNLLEVKAWKTKKSMVKVTVYITVAVNATMLSSIIATFFPVKEVALFMQCIHYASTEWLLIALLGFMEEYTKGVLAKNWTRMIFYVLTVLSNVSLLLNVVFHHVVVNEYVDAGNGMGGFVYHNLNPWYQIHFVYCCIIIVCVVSVLAAVGFKTTAFYRKKYSIPLVMLVLTVLADRVCGFMSYLLDYSLLAYILLAIFLIYYSIFYTPKSLITKTLSYVVSDSHSGVVCFDIEGTCIYANEVAMNIYGNPSDFSKMQTIFRKETGKEDFADIEEKAWDTVYTVGGQELHYQIVFNRLKDKKQNCIGCCFFLYDKTKDVERYLRERYRATHDSLTDLYNKEHFFESVINLLEQNWDSSYYMVCTDIKDFKLINSLFGFQKGNEILQRLADKLRNTFSENSICGRIESDHFAVCIPKEEFSEGQIISCVNEVAELLKNSEYQMHIHAGIYAIQPEDKDASVMCDCANMAIANIKNNYDRIIAYYDMAQMEQVMREKHLVGEFDTALADKQFIMFLQPQVANDGTVLGAEALVRWQHPERGMIPPGEFIEVFEKTGLIHHLDQYIWECAAKKLSEWKKMGKGHLHISVNISAKDFYFLDIYKIFTELVNRYEISPDKLKLEITETALMTDQNKMLALLDKLQNYGFCVEIDDFGSGYSSLNMLKDIHADVLKIDMGFLRESPNYDRTRIILGMIVDLAKRLQMTVITEGVENEEQVAYLRGVGCDMFQGFYFDRPIPVADFETNYVNEITHDTL